MVFHILNELAADPSFLPLAAIFAVIVLARLVGQKRTF
jgi:hypothetical protein